MKYTNRSQTYAYLQVKPVKTSIFADKFSRFLVEIHSRLFISQVFEAFKAAEHFDGPNPQITKSPSPELGRGTLKKPPQHLPTF
jgi:hypothetical protein